MEYTRKWSCGHGTRVSKDVAVQEMNRVDWYPGEWVEDMTAEMAEREFRAAIERGAEPILEDWGAWCGWRDGDEAYLYGDGGEPYGGWL